MPLKSKSSSLRESSDESTISTPLATPPSPVRRRSRSGSGSMIDEPVPPPSAPSSPGAIERGDLHSRKQSSRMQVTSSSGTSSPPPSPSIGRNHRKNALIKYGSLFLLVGQMVGLVLLMRYSRTRTTEGGELYLASTAVFMMELLKFFLCLSVVFFQSGSSFAALGTEIYNHVWASPREMAHLCVPSFLYTIQNNLLYLALTNLDAATYQVLYQLKILTTAIFSATMLGRKFSKTKWASLVVLTCGVAVVQVSGSTDRKSSAEDDDDRNRLVGLVAVLSAACTSGFSGVYFERILKGSDVSVWMRNIQMGLPSMTIAILTVFLEDGDRVSAKGFFVGYSYTVASVIAVQAVGGLIVAVVVKYADNVLKVFASSFSILLSCLISAVAFDFRPNLSFLIGAFLVMLSTVMYSKPTKKVPLSKQNPMPLLRKGNGGVRKTSLVM